jgi:two-component system chemotaxis sensor kinase CheA
MFRGDRDVVATYKKETKERLKTLEAGLRSLERQPSKPDPELLRELFRATHSIKAGANLLGLTPIEELAHLMESLLDHFQTGLLKPDPESAHALQDGIDAIGVLVDAMAQAQSFNIGPELRRLRQALSRASG